MKTGISPEGQTPSTHLENQQPATAHPPLNESSKSQMHVYQQLRKMDNELAENKSASSVADVKPAP